MVAGRTKRKGARPRIRFSVSSSPRSRIRAGPGAGTLNPFTGEDFYNQVERALDTKGGTWERNLTNTNIWLTTKTPSHRRTFLAVIAPWRAADPEPTIERLSDVALRVTWPGAKARTIAFGKPGAVRGDIVVDYVDVREKCASLAVADRAEIAPNLAPAR